ncbi:MAG: type II toxin-antitoxin system HigA family antitoxin [Gammaproteobacteria bacterium]
MMNIKPVKTEADYDLALARVDDLMDARPNSKEGDELDVLVTLIEKYEALYYPIDAPNPIEAIRFRMDQYDLKDKDLIPYIGQSGRVSEVLGFKRKLTLTMIRRLHSGLKIPTESLIQDYELKNG